MTQHSAVKFVVHKIHAKNHPATIAEMLSHMGYGREEIADIFIQTGQQIDGFHQDLVANNDFLPPLKSHLDLYFKKGNIEIFESMNLPISIKKESVIILPPQFERMEPQYQSVLPPYPAISKHVRGRGLGYGIAVTRHAFVFKLLNSLAIVTLAIIVAYLSIRAIDPKHQFESQLQLSYWIDRLHSVNSILLGAIIVIFGLYIFQLFTRRLHDAGYSKWMVIFLFLPILPFVTVLPAADTQTLLFMSLLPAATIFLISILTPSHYNRI
ncbi:MAG: DUF805 domain-containing protein [bacterium]